MIFSVCQIRKFSETTECLLDEIIVFVNKIVKIVHECSKMWDGVPINNYGDRYILAWKLPTDTNVVKLQHSKSGRSVGSGDLENTEIFTELKNSKPAYAPWMKEEIEDFEEIRDADLQPMREMIADKVLISAVKTLAELFREQDLQAYSRHPKILPKFGKDYKTEISFGIHVGYSIEGSIGTDMKVDALYISPDV